MLALGYLKALLRELSPPIVWRSAHAMKVLLSDHGMISARSQRLTFKGDYKSFKDALRMCGHGMDENYQQEVILSTASERTLHLIEHLETNPEEHLDGQTLRLLAAMQLINGQNSCLNVIDFSGALGNHYFKVRPYLSTKLKVHWNVVELPATAALGSQKFANDELSFCSDVNELSIIAENSIVLASGSLHYCEDPFSVLDSIIKTGPCAFIVDRMPLISKLPESSSSRIVIQTVPASIYKACYPVHMISESTFLNFWEQNGWYPKLKWFSDERIYLDGQPLPYQGMLLCPI